MKRSGIIRRIIIALMIITFLSGCLGGLAEGILPSLTENTGTAMPSIGEALQRDPDSETENTDGSVTECFTNISNAEYETFSVYLQKEGAALSDYKLENNVLTAEIQVNGVSFFLNYDIGSGEAAVTYPAGTYGKKAQKAETQPGADEQEGDGEQYKKIGDIVIFGTYEQDNDPANGPEAIEWIVLDYDEKENKALLISKYALDAMAYNWDPVPITWEACALREWLNETFLNTAFNEAERTSIQITEVDNSPSQGNTDWHMDGGNNTQDKVFLLSYAEAWHYFGAKAERECLESRVEPTPYAIEHHAFYMDDGHRTADNKVPGHWWLRTPGAVVVQNGSCELGDVDCGVEGVRPALWLSLDDVERGLTSSAESDNHEGVDEGDLAEAESKDGIASYKKPGSIVTFGTYEQDNNLENGPEAIEWIVLDYDEKENKVLLISKYGLDAQPYSYKGGEITEITWESCFLRNWLNEDFQNAAFTVEEQAAILMTEVDNSDSQGCGEWNTTGGNNTNDRVFLLSYAEACQYLGFFGPGPDKSNMNLKLSITPFTSFSENHSYNRHETGNGEAAVVWWLRSPGENQETASTVFSSILVGGIAVDDVSVVVRPALWLDLNAVERTLTSSAKNNSREETTGENSAEAENEDAMASYKKPGKIVTFGTYEQDNNLENGLEPIEWIVLNYDERNNQSLLISKYGLDTITFDEWSTKKDITWEGCRARRWLNDYFLYSAFNKEERKAILVTEVDDSESQDHLRHEKRELQKTQDRIFLLSNKEAELYLGVTNAAFEYEPYVKARVAPTAYAVAQGAYASDEFKTAEGLPAGSWLLRTYAGDCKGMLVNQGGTTNNEEFNAKYIGDTVMHVARPVFWLDLNAVEKLLLSSTEKGKDDENPKETKRKAIIDSYSRAGNIVTYGQYEQDNDLTNGPEPIEWIVLTVDDTNNRAMLLSKYGLDTITFDEWSTRKDITWEDCRARKWLNNYFLYCAFDGEEREAIIATEIDNSESQKSLKDKTIEVKNTQDRISLLSKSEVALYFGAQRGYGARDPREYDPYLKPRVAPTTYAIAQGAFVSDQYQTLEGLPAGLWLLRTYAGDCKGEVVSQAGVFGDFVPGQTGSGSGFVARPVFWLDLDAAVEVLLPSEEEQNLDENPEEAERKAIRDSYLNFPHE